MELSEREGTALLLSQRIQPYVERGWRVEHRDDLLGRAVLVSDGTRVNHVLHLLLTVLTAGLWLLVWFMLGAFHRQPERVVVTIDDPPGAHADRSAAGHEFAADADAVYRAMVKALPGVAHLTGTRTADRGATFTTRAGGFSWGGDRLVGSVESVSVERSVLRVTTEDGRPVRPVIGGCVSSLLREVDRHLRDPDAPAAAPSPVVRKPIAVAAGLGLLLIIILVAVF